MALSSIIDNSKFIDIKICEWLFINNLLLSEGENLLSALHRWRFWLR